MPLALNLRSWTQPGAQDAARDTYAAVRHALDTPAVRAFDAEIFLQGSYANHTNTRGDSDVDIVVMMRATYMPDISRLGPGDQLNYERSRTPGTHSLGDLRSTVQTALVNYFGPTRVNPKNKCIRVDKTAGYVDADVVPAMQERLFTSFPSYGSPRFIEGISIQPLQGGRIVNYPKAHILNGEAKNAAAGARYKPTVRQIKRLRRAVVDAGLLGPKDAPGYVLECLTFNAPNHLFVADNVERPIKILAWLHSMSAEQLAAKIQSCDEIHWLFRTDPGQHNQYTAVRVLQALWDAI